MLGASVDVTLAYGWSVPSFEVEPSPVVQLVPTRVPWTDDQAPVVYPVPQFRVRWAPISSALPALSSALSHADISRRPRHHDKLERLTVSARARRRRARAGIGCARADPAAAPLPHRGYGHAASRGCC